jgi:hypothetical protein
MQSRHGVSACGGKPNSAMDDIRSQSRVELSSLGKKIKIRLINPNFSGILSNLKSRYCTIFFAIFCGDIPLNLALT